MDKNQTVPLQGWTSSPNGRGTIDILSSSGITLFLCSWSVLSLNVFPPSFGDVKKAWRKLLMALLCFIGPEFIFQLAVGQWCSARRSVEDFKKSNNTKRPGCRRWTMTHAFFANMGGFALQTQMANQAQWTSFPLDAKQVLYLVDNDYISYEEVCIQREDIKDKDKVDGVVRLIIVCQIFWFFVCCVARIYQHLTVTALELATLGFIFCSMGTYYFWFYKPMDVGRAIILTPTATIEEILCDAGDKAREPYRDTPMDFVYRDEWSWTRYWTHWKGIVRIFFRVNFDRTIRPIDKIPDDNFPHIMGWPMWVLFVFQTGYGVVHLSGWTLPFPTHTEKLLWHISTVTIMVCILGTWIVEVTAWRSPIAVMKKEKELDVEENDGYSRRLLKRVAARMRNTTASRDPEMDVPLRALIPVIIEGFVGLRALPPSAYESVDWTVFLPHF